MRHAKKGKKLGRTHKPRMALLKNQAISLLLYESITTTQAKAKALKPIIDKVIHQAKDPSLHSRRQLLAFFNNNEVVVKKLLESLAPRYEDRPSGFTSLVRLPNRKGDNAPMTMISLITD